ncbi:hypothetical protein NKG94_13695 [Micromonospora sp. M12]
MRVLDGGDRVALVEDERLVRRGGMPISARDRHVTASSNQTFSTNVACFTRPSNVVRDGTSDRRACSSVSPFR